MKDIPKVSFLKTNKATIEFEIFTLDSLFSRQDRLDHSLYHPHRVAFYCILFFSKGSGVHEIDFKPYRYSEGSVLFISKGQVQAFERHPGTDGFMMLFTEDFISKNLIHSDILSRYGLYNYHLHSPLIYPEETGEEHFSHIISEIFEEYLVSDDFAKEEILRSLLNLLLLKAERIKRTIHTEEKNTEWLIKFGLFRNLLENYFSKTRNAKDYAGMMDISYKYLNEICKSISGSTAKEFIDKFIILETKRHLAMSDSSIKELTYEFGFDEPTNFVKFFKKHTAQTPSQFKKMLIK